MMSTKKVYINLLHALVQFIAHVLLMLLEFPVNSSYMVVTWMWDYVML